MFLFYIAAVLLSHYEAQSSVIVNEVVPDKELVLAFVINRHGERAPDADELSFSEEQEKLKNMTYLYGPEGLTDAGKRRAYQLGKFYRKRYGPQGENLISSLYIPDEIAIRSTAKDRTKMTILVAMSAVYPPEVEQQWNSDLGKVWQPVPYSSVPLDRDYLRYYSNCQRYLDLMAQAKIDSMGEEFNSYQDLIYKLHNITGRNFTENPLLFETLFDLFKSSISLGLDIPEWARSILPRLSEAARLAYRLYFRNNEMKKLGGGVILNDFIEAATSIAEGKPVSQRLRIYSAHDFNIGALMDVTGVIKEQNIPEYGSAFALELYKSKSSGEFSVLPMYLSQAGEASAKSYLFAGCESYEYCDLNTFKQLTKKFMLPEIDFYEQCAKTVA